MPDPVGQPDTQTDSLSPWAAPYVTDMLGKGQAISNTPYQAYSGPLTAGSSALQDTAFAGLSGINVPTANMGGYTPGSFTSPGTAEQYMNPYLNASLTPQLQEAQRQAEMQRMSDAGRLTKAGAYGGSRQAIMESEGNRNLMTNLAGITGAGYNTAFNNAQQQFNTEQAQQQAAQGFNNQFGLSYKQAINSAVSRAKASVLTTHSLKMSAMTRSKRCSTSSHCYRTCLYPNRIPATLSLVT